jgi:hydrogenase expression/formation protein HypC
MCLAIPAKVVEINGQDAVVEFHNVRRDVRLDLIDDCQIGDYVLIHAGFVINKLDEQSAQESLRLWDELIETMDAETEA